MIYNLYGVIFEDRIVTLNLNRFREEYQKEKKTTIVPGTPQEMKMLTKFDLLLQQTIASDENLPVGVCMTSSEEEV
jgi:hypothetical protein